LKWVLNRYGKQELFQPRGFIRQAPGAVSQKPAAADGKGTTLLAPMPGMIIRYEKNQGDKVEKGETILILEAMKMEQPLTAHKSGTITGLNAEVGTTVPAGTVLCEIKS